MRVAIFSARMFGFSGVELFSFDLALALRRSGHMVTVHAENWADHFAVPLRREDVATLDLGTAPAAPPDVVVSPKYGPLAHAQNLGRPCVQVIHSEHTTDVPVEHPLTRGFVTIRKGQDFLIDAAGPWAKSLPRAVIRNPIGFDRAMCDARKSQVPKTMAGVLVSEFDDMKRKLAEEYARLLGSSRPVVLIGPWRSGLGVPDGCIRSEASLFVWPAYRCAETACSYRYSRTLAEAAWCNTGTWVRGDLEGNGPTCEDAKDAWRFVTPDEVDLEAHSYDVVAKQYAALFERVLA